MAIGQSKLTFLLSFQCLQRYTTAHVLLYSLAQTVPDNSDRRLLEKCKWPFCQLSTFVVFTATNRPLVFVLWECRMTWSRSTGHLSISIGYRSHSVFNSCYMLHLSRFQSAVCIFGLLVWCEAEPSHTQQ